MKKTIEHMVDYFQWKKMTKKITVITTPFTISGYKLKRDAYVKYSMYYKKKGSWVYFTSRKPSLFNRIYRGGKFYQQSTTGFNTEVSCENIPLGEMFDYSLASYLSMLSQSIASHRGLVNGQLIRNKFNKKNN